MGRFTLQKLIHKKWLNLCTFLGMVLLIGVAVGNTLYQGAALNRVLQKEFDQYIGEYNSHPAKIQFTYPIEYETGVVSEEAQQIETELHSLVTAQVDMKIWDDVVTLATDSLHCIPEYKPDDSKQEYFFVPTYLEDMEYHIEVLKGNINQDTCDEQGIYECLINERIVANYNLSVGEILTFDTYELSDGKPLQIRVAGIFKENDVHDAYWVKAPNDYEKNIFVSKNTLNSILEQRKGNQPMNVALSYDVLFAYENVSYKKAADISLAIEKMIKGELPYGRATASSDLSQILNEFASSASRVKATMKTLQVPLYVLLFAFLYMVSAQVFDMEQNEIAMLKSRGVSKLQIIFIYFMQALVLSLLGAIPGTILGIVLTKVLGSANAFMEFVSRSRLQIVWDINLFTTLLITILIAVLFMTLPALKYTALSVVEIKGKKHQSDKAMWQKYYLDVVLTGAAIYIRYSLSLQQDTITQQILKGESIDPILFLSSVLFILGCGLFFLRILKGITGLIYKIGKQHWKPAAYVSFLQIIRDGKKMNFICVFIILTIAMGIFYADTARTMNTSMEERIVYNVGTDIVIQEQWKNNLPTAKRNKTMVTYEEPNYMRYQELDEEVESMTRVVNEKSARILYDGAVIDENQLMAIHTKEFGETAWLKQGVLDQHWYHYLNTLGQEPNGVLVSSNFRDMYGAAVGDSIQYSMVDLLENTRALQTSTIVGFVDVWPGYSPYKEIVNGDGSISYTDNYLIVANYSQVVNVFGITPYEIWMKTDANSSVITDFANERGIELNYILSARDDVIRTKTDAVVQLTNGLLTISFIVVMILCTVGFLIHWILSIKKRELMYGIYRAMGMGMKEIIAMLLHEQFFASFLSIVAGVLVGFLAAYLYIPLVMIAYLPEKHALTMSVITTLGDMGQIGFVVAIMLVVCFVVLSKVVKNMKIAQALKLGED